MIPSSDNLRDKSTAAPPPTSIWLGFVSFGAVIAAQVYSILTSPAEGDMGHLQKIMYVHVPAAWMTFLSFFVVLVFSVKYLWPELCARRFVTSPVTQIVPTCPSNNRFTCDVNSDTDKILRPGATETTGAASAAGAAAGAVLVASAGNNSPLKSHCDLDCLPATKLSF